MIQVYGYPNTRSTRVTWMLEELNKDYEFILINFMAGDLYKEPYQSINPAGKVPAIKDQDLVLTESAAIVTYLGDKYPDKKLVPITNTTFRGLYNQWCYFVVSELEQPLWTMTKHTIALPKEVRKPEIFNTAEWEYQKALYVLSQGLGNKPYILGDYFSAADILLAHTLLWGNHLKQLTVQDNLISYVDRLKQRPALKNAKLREKSSVNQEES